MNTYQMKYFLTTVNCLNMTLAAEKLNMTQSALSRSISSLESELGVRLFIRDKRKRLRLTADGTHQQYGSRSYCGAVRRKTD